MKSSLFELQVLVAGNPVREYGHQGRTYVEGRAGSKFTLRFRNNSAHRVLAIPSVDGISALDGEPATGDSRGYIVPALSSVEITGWRESLESTAKFVFTDREKAYATQTAGDQNLGVIGVQVVDEVRQVIKHVFHPSPPMVKEEHHHYHYHSTLGSLAPTGPTYTAGDPVNPTFTSCSSDALAGGVMRSASMSASPDFNLGTGWGESQRDVVTEASFERSSILATLEIYYSDRAGLTRAGIALDKDLAVEARDFPRAFGGFCRPPQRIV